MKRAGYIVIRGGRPCALVPIPQAKSGALILGEPVALFADQPAANHAILLTLQRTSQLRGAKIARDEKEQKAAAEDRRIYAVVPLEAVGSK